MFPSVVRNGGSPCLPFCPVLLCFVLGWRWELTNLQSTMVTHVSVIEQLLLYLACPPSMDTQVILFYFFFSEAVFSKSASSVAQAHLKGQMMLLPGSPCSCHPCSSPNAPSAPAMARFQASCYRNLQGSPFTVLCTPKSSASFEFYKRPWHICRPSLTNSTSWVRGFTMAWTTAIAAFHVMEHQTRSIRERNLKSPFLPRSPPVVL